MKKLFIVILCGIVLLNLAACNSNSSPSDSSVPSYTANDSKEDSAPTGPVFNTENIVSITFYSFYGESKGSQVPSEHMPEIINWLDSFTIDKKADDKLLGVNALQVEIKYSDGTVIKEGLDLILVDSVAYYIKGDARPECFAEIIEKTSLEDKTIDSIVSNDSTTSESTASTTEKAEKPTKDPSVVFDTENVKRITFYAYYGNGKGSDVPAVHMAEIINWLDSFEIDTDREFPKLLPPGTNTIKVEIEYLDGTVVKKGMDTTTVDGIPYYIKGDTAPECFDEIRSKTSLD